MEYNNNVFIKNSYSQYENKILKYINSSEVIKELPLKKLRTHNSINVDCGGDKKKYNKKDNNLTIHNYIIGKSPILKNKNGPKILKSFSENDLLLPYDNSKNLNQRINKINKNRPFSGLLYPCKTIILNKKIGPNSRINEFNLKLASKKIISNQKLLSNFMKKNFKFIRNNSFSDNFYYIKSKLNKTTKSTEKKLCNQEVPLSFDNEKYKKFRTISKKIKKHLLSSNEKLSIKDLLEQIKKLKNEKNKERISLLKEDIEDNKILYTPKNFIKFRKDDFSYYKLNQLIKKLNCDFTYGNRFILAHKFDIQLEDYIRK